ncbi:hypothetical protein K0B04_04110 [Patescibacteria group bacterium]|nr:hypothetical protein [Patescibacteria group bacterium]
MEYRFKKTITIIFILSVFAGNFIYPTPAYARISFNRFNRNIRKVTRGIGRGTKFVVNLPDKATRWMGPTLGPIASTILTRNISNHSRWGEIFRRAQRVSRTVESIEEKDKLLQQMRTAYRDQAGELRNQANDIRNSRTQLQQGLLSGEVTYEDYRNNVLALEEIAQVYETTADKFDSSANNMRIENIAGIISRDMIDQIWVQSRNAVIHETKNEISRFINPDIIKNFITGGVNFDTFLDGIASHYIDKHSGDDKSEADMDALRERVRNRIKEILEENKDEFKQNWREKVDEIVKNKVKELEDEKKNLPEVETKDENKEGDAGDSDKSGESTTGSSDDRCPSGYEWSIKVGKCFQSNCYPDQIPNAHHSYVLDCVCGSAGSINENPDDPNKACRYAGDYKSCPNCVYACVGIKDECPNIE